MKQIKIIFLLTGLSLLFTPAISQNVPKRSVTSNDIKLWGQLWMENVSDGGNWISYELRHDTGMDSLILMNTRNSQTFRFLNGKAGQFSTEKTFAFFDKQRTLNLVDLSTGKVFQVQQVISFEFYDEGKHFVSIEKGDTGDSDLCFRNVHGQLLKKIGAVSEFKLNPKKNTLAYFTSIGKEKEIAIVELNKTLQKTTILKEVAATTRSLTWSKDGKSLAFYITGDKTSVVHYMLDTRKLSRLSHFNSDQNTMEFCVSSYEDLKISDDNKRVFFSYNNAKFVPPPKPVVELWNGNAKYLYPIVEGKKNLNWPYLAVWNVNTFESLRITNDEYSWVALTQDKQFAIIANKSLYGPQYLMYPNMDYYLLDIKTGKKECFLKKHSGIPSRLSCSPDGQHVLYYSKRGWWIYNIPNKTHIEITRGLGVDFDNADVFTGGEVKTYGIAGWSKDEKWVVINDRFDIWKISLDGKFRLKLTNGRRNNLSYRFIVLDKDLISDFNYDGSWPVTINLNNSNVLSVENIVNGDTGYSSLHPVKGINKIVFDKAKISNIQKAKHNNTYIFRMEKFDHSPRIELVNDPSYSPRTLALTNAHERNFHHGVSEMIYFQDAKKKTLSGALFYPANYDPKVKYPMIVYVYATLSSLLHEYVNPSQGDGYGFNVTNFTNQGYIVLMPDIAHELGNPGVSAVDCVTSAVKTIIGKGIVDPAKIGLYGHSFGGYETDFIITQTNIFAAAISGSGPSDMIRSYFTVNAKRKDPEAWRFENQQYHMGKSFYQDKDAYIRNSPLFHAEQIQTPLLIWTGKEDSNVKPEQSIAFHIALRRLEKEHILLQYPNEGHILQKPESRKDLTERTLQWFDYYLKKEKPADWILRGTSKLN